MKYISKRFLSDDADETGSMVVKVETTSRMHTGRYQAENPSVEAEVTFRDCHGKPIYLQFTVDPDHPLQARYRKIDLIIEELQLLKLQLRIGIDEANEAARDWLAANPDKGDDE